MEISVIQEGGHALSLNGSIGNYQFVAVLDKDAVVFEIKSFEEYTIRMIKNYVIVCICRDKFMNARTMYSGEIQHCIDEVISKVRDWVNVEYVGGVKELMFYHQLL